jgi:hypothetical protein
MATEQASRTAKTIEKTKTTKRREEERRGEQETKTRGRRPPLEAMKLQTATL